MAETPQVDLTELSDRALLRRFAQSADEDAFRQLVDRHGPLVLAACRRGLSCSTDADDAFQATFLVLARSANKIRKGNSVAAWLYGVATRVAMRMRRNAARRSTHELMDTAAPEVDPLDELLARHDGNVADEELNKLPDSLRTPLVLRYLVGRSNAEVAEELGITIAALEGRLKRGKQRLRMRLLRRGVTLAVVVAMLKSTRVVANDIPSELVNSTVDLAFSGSSATIAALANEPATSTHIALQELSAMNVTILSKPVVAAATFGGILAAALTAQVAFSQGEGHGNGNPFALDAAASSSAEEEPAASTSLPAQRTSSADPFAADSASSVAAPSTRTITGATAANSASGRRIVDFKPRSKSELAIERALAQPLNSLGLEFQSAPLSEVVNFLRDEYNIEVQIDIGSLDNLGVSPDEPVDVNIRNVNLESAIELMLAPLDLTYVIDKQVLLILTEEDEEYRLEARVYPNPHLKDFTVDKLMQVVAPDSWEVNKGQGTAVEVHDRIIINQTYHVHKQINELLSQLMESQPATSLNKAIRRAEMGIMDGPAVDGVRH